MLAQSGKDLMKEAILWTDGYIGRWSLDETSGKIATDTSGKNDNATLAGGVTFGTNSIAPAKLINGLLSFFAAHVGSLDFCLDQRRYFPELGQGRLAQRRELSQQLPARSIMARLVS